MRSKANPGTGVAWHQAIRIQSLVKALEQDMRHIQSFGQQGRSADGSPYLPLSPESWNNLASPLEAILRLADEAALLVGDERKQPSPPRFAATRTAISGRLAQMEEIISDLRPDRLQKSYGDLPPAVARGLAEITGRMEALLREARGALDRARAAEKRPSDPE
jgi:hypothetical protein